MGDQLKTIDEYYTNLEYGNNKEIALTKISTLAKEINLTDDDFSERFLGTISVIKKYLSFFQSACKHVDTITTIIEYLNTIRAKLITKYDQEYDQDDVILLAILTILKICPEHEIQLFLENAMIKNSRYEKSIRYENLRCKIMSHTNEIILLADSDLYAFISYLRNKDSIFLPLNIIRVQEPIKEKLLWLLKEYLECFDYHSRIRTFRTKNELFKDIPDETNDLTTHITSIWTEDIIFAKNLALSLNRNVVFINTYMDFYGGFVLLPYTKIFDDVFHKWCKYDLDKCIKNQSVQKGTLSKVYNLFYDGTWQRPVKDTYWIHNESQWANATSEDVKRCLNSAKKGFKNWSTKSITYRIEVLSKIASALEYNGKSKLANIITSTINYSYIYRNCLSCSQNGESEVMKIRNPKGVIILKEQNEHDLFYRLIQNLTIGNSVIVICSANICDLAPYYNIFAASKIPPGVINLLSNENTTNLEIVLCGTDYTSYAEQLFADMNMEKMYVNLTIPKHVILPLK